MTLQEIIQENQKLQMVKGIKGFQFNYAINMNLSNFKKDIKILTEQENEINELIKPYQEQLKLINEKYATVDGKLKTKKDYNGQSIIEKYDVPVELQPQWNADKNLLKEKHKESIDKHFEVMNKYIEYTKSTESTCKPYLIQKQYIPDDISTEEMALIFNFIDHDGLIE